MGDPITRDSYALTVTTTLNIELKDRLFNKDIVQFLSFN